MSQDYPYYRRSVPRQVEGGIKARSTRGSIGESWWSRRFVDVIESYALGSRMTRGRSYARSGQVISLDVTSGVVTSSVQGSRKRPYSVTIGLQPFKEKIWTRVETILAEQAFYSARLLAGEMPPEMEEVFLSVGQPLFPATVRGMTMKCSCPDSAVPCKHLAATFYVLAEAFDCDPFQILRWRGRDKESLLSRIRALRSADHDSVDEEKCDAFTDHVTAMTAPAVGAAFALDGLGGFEGEMSEQSCDRFWACPRPVAARPLTVPTEPDLVLRQLPDPSAWLGGRAVVDRLRPAYERFVGRTIDG